MSMIYCTAIDQHIDTDYDAEHQLYCEECGDITVYEDMYKNNWIAYRGDYDLGATVGHGKTRDDAIADLVDMEA